MFNRRLMLQSVVAVGLTSATGLMAETVASVSPELKGNLSPVHDPTIIKADGLYHLFSTSQMREAPGLIHWRTSKDLINWEFKGAVMTAFPDWVKTELPETRGAWAPDIQFHNGIYRLYYSLSLFGKNTSVIAMLTTPTLNTDDPAFSWKDEGVVLRSVAEDHFNAIDSHLFIDDDGRQWLSWGSFWGGIQLAEADPVTGKLKQSVRKRRNIARRPPAGAVEAPVIIKQDGYYYLFVSYDFCCRGLESSYYTVVGRARKVTGPYVDDQGRKLTEGGGRRVIHADMDVSGRFKGPGHVDILRDEGRDYIVYHAYDSENRGRPTLRIKALHWTTDGWPEVRSGAL